MRISKSYGTEILFVLVLSFFCFIFPFAILKLKTFFYPSQTYDIEIRCFYLFSGVSYILATYIYLIRKGNYRFLPIVFCHKTPYVLLNFSGFCFFPILLFAFYNANFPRDVYEGVGIPCVLLMSAAYILFLNIISLGFYFINFLLKQIFSSSRNRLVHPISILGFTVCALLCVIALYHLYEGRFCIANPEFFSAYTILTISLNDRKANKQQKFNDLI